MNENQSKGRPSKALPLRRVVVATDFSAGGTRAVERAARLVAPGAQVVVVHVLPASLRKDRKCEARAREGLDDAEARVHDAVKGVAVESVLAYGEAFEELLRVAADQERAELIVLGRHGTRRFRNLLLGTTAERLVRHGTFPALIVNLPVRRVYRRLLAAVELPPEGSRRAVELGLRLTGAHLQDRRVVHVRDDLVDRTLRRGGYPERDLIEQQQTLRAEASATLQAWLQTGYPGLQWSVSVPSGDPRAGILAIVEHRQADLLCLGTHARKGLARAFLGSVAEGVLREVTCDVLIAAPVGEGR
ncbi:MAG: universal stress protein [Archangium sp.]|nr:universal stress protein [Archangium sp.]